MTDLFTLDDLSADELSERAVLARVDFNVPLEEGEVADDTRLRETLPTLRDLSEAGARTVLVAHLGRPGGERDPEASLRPVARQLGELLGREIGFAEDCVGEPAHKAVSELEAGEVCLLENLRFHPGEKSNQEEFARSLAALAELYVGDAFGAAHRAHASVVGVPALTRRKAAGRLMVREVEALSRLLGSVDSPFVAVVGGAKIEGKMDTLDNLLGRIDSLVIGGGMANTFLAARGVEMGDSLLQAERLEMALDLLQRAESRGVEVHLPTDLVVAEDLKSAPPILELRPAAGIPGGRKALDIGSETRARFAEILEEAGTVFWNGPMGVFERPPFDAGTRAVAEAVASCPGYTVVGGGETTAAVGRVGVRERIDHVSTGGGAALELLAGRELPGVEALRKGDS
ncbi:MAG: phosphoglycerate kinase [Thermoanaerobaculia bacterium]|nr:phosphoglycerate kinase [Thermoanaerobaculia bacterium]